MPAVFLLEALGDHLWGFKPNLMADFVEQRGALPALFWFAKNMPKYEHILEKWGPVSTHLIATVISTLNGCRYSIHGHAYALELHYLHNTDKLFALSKVEMVELHELSEKQILERFEQALVEADLAEEILLLNRVSELRQDSQLALSRSDQDLLHLIQMFEALSDCAKASNTPLDSAHDPIGKNRALRDRYAKLRRDQRLSNATQPPSAQPPSTELPVILNPADLKPAGLRPAHLDPVHLSQDAYQDAFL
jgi:alkylhydroperoxidase family enzyme